MPQNRVRSAVSVAVFSFFTLCLTLCATSAFAQATYTWNQTGTASWATATNWTPNRTTLVNTDILVFNNGATTVANSIPAGQTIGQLLISGNTNVTLQPAATGTTLTIGGGTGTDLTVPSGSQLNISGASTLTVALSAGVTGTVGGSMTFTNAAHKITAADANGLTFQNGSTFTAGTGFSSGAFGTAGTTNSVVFASGSKYVSLAGANPFQTTGGLSQFQTGSLYSHQQSGAPSFSGRTYADFEYKNAAANSATGGNPFIVDNLTISQGTLNLGMTNAGSTIKGNISVAASSTLGFNSAGGTMNLGGTAAQTITNAGTFSVSTAGQIINVNNANGIILGSNITIGAGTLALASGTVTTGAGNTLSIASAASVTRTNGYVIGNLKKTFGVAGSKVFEVGTANGYSPVTANVTGGTLPGDLTIVAVQGPQPNMTAATSLQRYWTLTATGITSDLTFQYLAGDVAGNEANYQLARVSGGTPTFFPGTVDTGTHTASLTNVSSFSDWTVGEAGADTTPPVVTSVAVPPNATYVAGQNLDFTVNFTENVTVNTSGGTPRVPITLNTGGTVYANYFSGTGSSAIVFRYTVVPGNDDPDGVTVGSAFETNGGTIRDAAANNATPALNNVANTTGVHVDAVAPNVSSIVRANADPTGAANVDFTVTFDSAVTGVDTADFSLTTTGITGASVTNVSGSGTTRTVTASTGSGATGTLRLDVNNGASIQDLAGNALAAGFTGGQTYTIDRSAPAVQSVTRVNANPTRLASVDYTVTFTQGVTGVDMTDFALTTTGVSGTSITGVTGASGSSSYVVSVNTGSGDGTIRLDVQNNGSIQSATSVPLAAGFTSGEVYTVDKTAPVVQSIVRANPNPTGAASVSFTVTYSEAVTGVSAQDWSLNTSGVTGASVSGFTGSGAVYTVNVNTGSGNGTIRLDVITGGTVIDLAGNALTTGFTAGETYNIDKLPPLVQSITRANTNPSAAPSVDFTVTFTEPVVGVDSGDFVLSTTGVSGASISGVTGTAATYTVSVNTGTGDGSIRLDLIDNNTIQDPAGNPLGGPGPGNGDFTTGETYTITRPPLPPANVVATPSNNQVSLTWNSSAGATGYNVKRSTVSGGPYTTISPNQPTTAYTDNAVTNGTTYYYVVSALNGNGESADTPQVSATPNPAPNQIGVVISQLFGGNGGAYNQDYVELYNPTAGSVNIGGYSLQYGSATGQFGSVATNIYTFPNPTNMGPGRYLTVSFGAPSGTGAAVSSDINVPTGLNMSGASGKVAFAINGTALGCGATATPCTLPHANIVDVVAYGASNNGEGGTSVKNGAALSTSEGALRKQNGCQDTQNNNNDFTAATIANGLVPRTAAVQNTCGPQNNPPSINSISDPYTTVAENAAPFAVNLSGFDDGGIYTWAFTAGAGIQNITISSGQGTPNITYTVTLQTNFYGTATFTALLNDGVNPNATRTVNITVTRDVNINHVPTITPPPNPYTTVGQNAAPFNVNLTGNDDNNLYTWGATPGAGIQNVSVTAGQGTANVTYNVAIQAGFIGTATFTATLSDGVNPATQQTVNIGVSPTGSTVNHLVISQLYGAGGNASATWSNDYIEIYNPTGNPVNLVGWTLQYSSATNTGNFSGLAPLGGTIGPGQYFLVQLASNDTSVGAPLSSPTLTGDINMSGTNGKIALVNDSNVISGSCGTLLTDPNIVDFIGYGSTANCSEGSNPPTTNAPQPANNQSALFRASNGDVDTNNNAADFTSGAASPHTHVPPVEVGPFVVTTDPSSNDNIAPRDANIVITFNESVDVSGSWYDINCPSGNHNSATVSRSGSRSWTIVPNANFTPGEVCTVTLFASQIQDTDTDDSAPGTNFLVSNYSWNFTISTGTAPPYPSSVHLTMGNPSNAVADMNVPDNFLMQKGEYALSYNRSRGTPNWVSWHLTDEWIGTLTRNDTFRADPAIDPSWYRVLGSDYSGSGFDRGHMTPNADRDKETSVPINQATFLMTNMVPQAPDNNQGPWANLENYLRTLLPANELYIVAGPAGVGGTGANGFATTIANGNVTVPAQTWKVVLILPKASGDDVARVTASTCTLAVLMPNVQGIRTGDPNDWMQYITTVDNIEQLTGYDFFKNVPSAIQASIEAGTNCVNPPGAANLSANTNEDTPVDVTFQAVSPSNGTITYSVVANPSHGQLTGSGSSRTYTPAPDYNGSDSFTYRANDGTGNSNTATVSITIAAVNDPPVAATDSKTTMSGIQLTFPATDLTANDTPGPSDESGQTIVVTSVISTASTHGSVNLNNGQVTYQSDSNYTGPASFNYQICDNPNTPDSLCAIGTVNVDVTQCPLATVPTISGTLNGTNTTTQACPEQPLTLNASSTGATSYQWYRDGSQLEGETGASTVVTVAGNYTVTATNACGTTQQSANYGVQNPAPQKASITANGPTTFCQGGSVTLHSSSATGIQWYQNNVAIPNSATQDLPVTQSGSYTALLNDHGCHSVMSDPIVVTVTPLPATPAITPNGPTTFCAGGSVMLTSNNESGNQWYLNGAPLGGQTGSTLVVTASGDYTVVVTSNSCPSAPSAVTTVTVNPIPNATISVPASVTAGSTGNIASVASAGAGATYNWSITNGTITAGTGTNSITFTAGAIGTLNLQVTVTANGCSDTKSANVNVTPQPPAITITKVTPPAGKTAGGKSVTISGTGFLSGATVTFGGAAATNVVVVNSTTITAKTPAHAGGAVNVTVTNTNNTSATLTNGYTYVPVQFDANGDHVIDPSDIFFLVNYLFMGGAAPEGDTGMLSGDANNDGTVDPADIFYLISYLYLHGANPASIGRVTTHAAPQMMSGELSLGTPQRDGDRVIVPVVLKLTPGSDSPHAMSLTVRIPDATATATVHRAGAAAAPQPAFEISRRTGGAVSYLVSFDEYAPGFTSGVIAQIELDAQSASRGVLVIDPALTLLSNTDGTRKATLRINGRNTDRDEHAPAKGVK